MFYFRRSIKASYEIEDKGYYKACKLEGENHLQVQYLELYLVLLEALAANKFNEVTARIDNKVDDLFITSRSSKSR
ncbi:hypothetical protein [Clostridium lundense]|uniref:hypothetical protein n=1 Tax=Clostridium lundense TaxID=319475 RepID=UPI00146FC840|nr:hypothetical protein [Clostridium lundense]